MSTDVIVFDVNETLLDLAALDPLFERHLGAAALRQAWFGEMLVTAMTLNHIDRYHTFAEIGRACLATTAARARVRLADSAAESILAAMRALPPHGDVIPALDRLTASGFSLATLTNSPPAVAEAQLEHAGLAHYFDARITVAEAERLKPAREVYAAAEKRFAVPARRLMLVAAHTWDVAGAAHAGWRTALVARDAQIAHPLYPPPDLSGADLVAVADGIVAAS